MATVTPGYTFSSNEVVTPAKLNSAAVPTISNIVTADIVDANITTAKILNAAVTTAKIADAAVTTAKIADNNITAAKLTSDSVETAKIVNASVTAAKLANNAVETAKIADNSVTDDKLSLAANAGEIKKALNADNSPPIYACRAWAKFAGQSTNGVCTISASGNVTSVSRISAGVYEVVMTTAMPDANYAILTSSNQVSRIETFTETSTTFRLNFINTVPAQVDPAEAAFCVIR